MSVADRVSRVVDRVVGVFSPSSAVERAKARIRLGLAQRAANALRSTYRGAGTDRLNQDWVGGAVDTSADAALLPFDLPRLRARSRELNRDDAVAASITRVCVDNVVGTGIRPQSRVDADMLGITEEQAVAFQDSAERAFKRAVPFLDSTNRTDFFGLQRLVIRKLVEDGEVFAHPIRITDMVRPISTAIEIIEADRVDDPNDVGARRERLRSGVVLGKLGQPIAYWVQVAHPGDEGLELLRSGRRRFRRMTATSGGAPNILHVYQVKRPGQTRGEPMFAPVLEDLKDLQGYLQAERVAARIAACFAAFVTKEDPLLAADGNLDAATVDDEDRLEKLEPGIVEYLDSNEKVSFGDPKRPGNTFPAYVEHLIRRIGAAIGLPLELILCDFSKTNYTSGRMAGLEADRVFKSLRHLLTSKFCQPIYEARLVEALEAGELEGVTRAQFFANKDLWCAARWVEPARGWVDRNKEVPASEAAIAAGLSTLAEECAAQGLDWREVLEQRLREELTEKELREALGLTKPVPPSLAEAAGEGEDGDEDGDDNDGDVEAGGDDDAPDGETADAEQPEEVKV